MSDWGIPQWIVAVLFVLAVIGYWQLDGKPRKPWDFADCLIGSLLWIALLAWGGFWG